MSKKIISAIRKEMAATQKKLAKLKTARDLLAGTKNHAREQAVTAIDNAVQDLQDQITNLEHAILALSGLTKPIKVGQRLRDGSVYAGLSSDTGEPLCVLPTAPNGFCSWASAQVKANTLSVGGKTGWRLPTNNEMERLHKFSWIGNFLYTTYWTSTANGEERAWAYDFKTGQATSYPKYVMNRAFCVRSLV